MKAIDSSELESLLSENDSLQNNPKMFACIDDNKLSKTPSYNLTKVQYTNTLKDLFGTNAINQALQSLNQLPDDLFDRFSNQRLSTFSKQTIDSYHQVATAVANQVTQSSTQVSIIFGACANQTNPGANCIDNYLDNFSTRIFRRPLTLEEKAAAKKVSNASGFNYKDNLKYLLIYHLLSPQFLFRLELGHQNDVNDKFDLTPYEVASRISFLTMDAGPDIQLLDDAKSGVILDVDVQKKHVRRLLRSQNGQKKWVKAITKWSGMDSTEDISLSPPELLALYPSDDLQAAMKEEAAEFVDYIIFEMNGNFSDLLTSKVSFAVNSDLAKIYGHTPAIANRTPSSPISMMVGRRQGLLMRAPALTSNRPTTSIISRGVAFQTDVLCNELPPPPGDLADSRDNQVFEPDERIITPNREAITIQTQDVTCMACHNSINPTGFAFENFGPFGEIRKDEMTFDSFGNLHARLAIDTSTEVPTWRGAKVSVRDAFDLVSHVANAPEGRACFSRKMFRYLHEKRENNDDECQLDKMYQELSRSDGSIAEGLVNLIVNPSLLYKQK